MSLDLTEERIGTLSSDMFRTSMYLINRWHKQNAHNYFRFGFHSRIDTLRESRNFLKSLIAEDGTKYRDTTVVNIHINSFYINMFGALDNLAWALQHEFELIPDVSENNKQQSIGFFNKNFIKKFREKAPEQANSIQSFSDWYSEAKKLRDPPAHRMPLYCPPAVLFENHVQELALAKKSLSEIDYNAKPTDYMNTLVKYEQIGTFKAIFCVNFETESVSYPISKATNDDYANFLQLIEPLLRWLAYELKYDTIKTNL